ncbi:MAG TPA: transglutaminase-like domain-containing protein [Bryobacteraceae bacterium]|nr:transglutaminase-like domain-containing protein [Bryobacteraceae bacterium]
MLFYARVNDSDAQSLLDLLGRRPSRIELDRAALELARIEYPALDAGRYIADIDYHAAAIADRAHDLSDGPRFVKTANAYLFGEMQFRGNEEDYYNPANSYLNRVLETRIGIPITLSVIYMEIARRLAKPVHGVGLPGHFVVLYDDGQYSTYIDPFHGGSLIDAAGCCRLSQVDSLDPELLAPVDRRSIVMRMINNLRQIYFSQRHPDLAIRLLDLLIAADPASADEHKQRAVALLQQQRMADALAGFRKYLELSPGAADRERIEEQMKTLAFWLASRN